MTDPFKQEKPRIEVSYINSKMGKKKLNVVYWHQVLNRKSRKKKWYERTRDASKQRKEGEEKGNENVKENIIALIYLVYIGVVRKTRWMERKKELSSRRECNEEEEDGIREAMVMC